MRTPPRPARIGLAILLGWSSLVHLGCAGGDTVAPPDTSSSIRVVVESTGATLDPDGYTVGIDDSFFRSISSNGTVTHAVVAGRHTIRLGEVSSNCVVEGKAVRVVDATAGGVAEVRFTVQCTTAKGSIAVRVTTSRPELAAGGHRIVLDLLDTVVVAPIDSIEFRAVPDGTHSIAFVGATPFCYALEPVTRSVGVSGTPVLVELRVTCVAAPEGTILVNRNQGVQRVSVATGAAETAASSGKNGRWSPDGRQIAFAITRDNGPQVAVLTVGTGQVVDLGGGTDPSWSPDGSRIVFARSDGLYVMRADGSEVRLVLELTGIAGPVWSPNGAYIGFARTQPGQCSISVILVPCPTDVYFVRSDGTGFTRLSSNGGRQPSWSPTGSHLAYVRGGGFLTPGMQLIRLDFATRVEQTVRSSANGLASPVWSPDGSYIAIAADLSDQVSDVLLLSISGGPTLMLHQPGATPTSWR